jgi:A/G-specific adenine glycosylase
MPADKPLDIAGPLLRWYDRHKRDLPWRRREGDAYAQLVAEIMLQQTQVSTVVPYYLRFMERFPSVGVLAGAAIDDVLPLWAGLGYYSRARNLHAAARKIVEDHGGEVPRTLAELMDLPGVGRYTAGAVGSIAFGLRAPVLDGNVGRVLMRLAGMEADPKSPATRARLWELAEGALPKKRCGDFNQAMMELGATVCAPRGPNCLLCPLRAMCRAHLEGTTDRIPPPAKRTRVVPVAIVVAAIVCGERMLFAQRPGKGLWAGLWELPSEPVGAGESIAAGRSRLRGLLPKGVRLSAKSCGAVIRQLTHREITFHVYRGTTRGEADAGMQAFRWLTLGEAARLGISRACEAILKFCGDSR